MKTFKGLKSGLIGLSMMILICTILSSCSAYKIDRAKIKSYKEWKAKERRKDRLK